MLMPRLSRALRAIRAERRSLSAGERWPVAIRQGRRIELEAAKLTPILAVATTVVVGGSLQARANSLFGHKNSLLLTPRRQLL